MKTECINFFFKVLTFLALLFVSLGIGKEIMFCEDNYSKPFWNFQLVLWSFWFGMGFYFLTKAWKA